MGINRKCGYPQRMKTRRLSFVRSHTLSVGNSRVSGIGSAILHYPAAESPPQKRSSPTTSCSGFHRSSVHFFDFCSCCKSAMLGAGTLSPFQFSKYRLLFKHFSHFLRALSELFLKLANQLVFRVILQIRIPYKSYSALLKWLTFSLFAWLRQPPSELKARNEESVDSGRVPRETMGQPTVDGSTRWPSQQTGTSANIPNPTSPRANGPYC
jgi:hypothetical protein